MHGKGGHRYKNILTGGGMEEECIYAQNKSLFDIVYVINKLAGLGQIFLAFFIALFHFL